MEPADPAQLSCYTANLAGYLTGEVPDVTAHLAGSVRLAVRADPAPPVFSHHGYPLNVLPDGTRLRYAAAATFPAAAAGLAAELDRHGRVLAVADTRGLPWSPAHRRTSAAHWILVDGRRPGGWHVTDGFAALLPDGEQRPYAGWLTDPALAAALTPLVTDRDRYAFGVATDLPPARFRWLARSAARAEPAESAEPVDPGRWVEGAAAVDLLAGWFVDRGVDAAAALDDVWAAARHHLFRLRWLAGVGALDPADAARALDAWQALPRALVFAVTAARRGRPRPEMIRTGFAQVRPWTADRRSP